MNAYVGGGRVIRKPLITGGTAVAPLLHGPNIGSYEVATTKEPAVFAGTGISKSLGNKLSNLVVKPLSKKPKNIVFDI